MMRGWMDVTIRNPLVLRNLRSHGIYAWGNLATFACVAAIVLASLVRFACVLHGFHRSRPLPVDLHEPLFRSHHDLESIGAYPPFLSIPELFAEQVQVISILGLLLTLAPRLLLDLVVFVRRRPLFPEDLRATPITPRQILAAGVDAPFLRLAAALPFAIPFLLLPQHRTGSLPDFDPRPGTSLFASLVLVLGWAAAFAAHRVLLAVARSGMDALVSVPVFYFALATWFVGWIIGRPDLPFLSKLALWAAATWCLLRGVREATDRLLEREIA